MRCIKFREQTIAKTLAIMMNIGMLMGQDSITLMMELQGINQINIKSRPRPVVPHQ